MLKIVTAPNELLAQKAKKVVKFNTDLINLVSQMRETLANTRDPEGVGLAAPQVGQSLQLFIVQEDPQKEAFVVINPKIIEAKEVKNSKKKKTKRNTVKLEGCLSLPNIWGEVKRAHKIKLSYQNEKGETLTKTFTGFESIIVQHEYDHLQGILFPKRVIEQKGVLYKSHKNQKGEDVFDEIDLP